MWGSKVPRQPYDTCSLYKGGSKTNLLSPAAQAGDELGSLPLTLPSSLQQPQLLSAWLTYSPVGLWESLLIQAAEIHKDSRRWYFCIIFFFFFCFIDRRTILHSCLIVEQAYSNDWPAGQVWSWRNPRAAQPAVQTDKQRKNRKKKKKHILQAFKKNFTKIPTELGTVNTTLHLASQHLTHNAVRSCEACQVVLPLVVLWYQLR